MPHLLSRATTDADLVDMHASTGVYVRRRHYRYFPQLDETSRAVLAGLEQCRLRGGWTTISDLGGVLACDPATIKGAVGSLVAHELADQVIRNVRVHSNRLGRVTQKQTSALLITPWGRNLLLIDQARRDDVRRVELVVPTPDVLYRQAKASASRRSAMARFYVEDDIVGAVPARFRSWLSTD